MQSSSASMNWLDWLERWDRQQRGYLPEREQRFEAMLDVVEMLMPERFVALDLACGPGSLSRRLLARFPQAHCLAVDLDPVLLALGQGALGDMQGRLRWVEVDLRDVDWLTHLGEKQVDVVLSTTALHWLPPETLVGLYQQLSGLVRPGGLFLNGDHFSFDPHLRTLQLVSEKVLERKTKEVIAQEQPEDWKTWWGNLSQEPGMKGLFAERERRFAWRDRDFPEPSLSLHEEALQCRFSRGRGDLAAFGQSCHTGYPLARFQSLQPLNEAHHITISSPVPPPGASQSK